MNNNFFYKNNRLQQLRGFCVAAEFQSLTKAAKTLKLSHSSISLQIKSLERDLEVKLFDRNGPSIKLTEDGKKLYQISRSLVEGIDHIPKIFKNQKNEIKKTELKLAANTTTLNFVLPGLLKKFLRNNKSIFVDIYHAEQDEVVDLLRSDKIEVALLPKREHKPFPSDIVFTKTSTHKACLITRKDHSLAKKKKITVDEIGNYDMALPSRDLRVIPNLYDIFPDHNIQKRMKINFTNWETTKKYIEAGLVISISSDIIMEKGDNLVATPLDHLFSDVEYGYVVKKRSVLSQNARLFIDSI